MKKIYLFFVFLTLLGCQSNNSIKVDSISINCPSILFSKDHKYYLDSIDKSITFENISYKAEINNVVFDKNCQIKNTVFSNTISILFIINLFEEDQDVINLPFYLALFDKDKNLKDIQYFLISDSFRRDPTSNIIMETEIITSQKIKFKLVKESDTFLIGFMLDKKRLELLSY